MVSLHPASIDEIRDSWPFFLNGISEVIDKCGLDFHPADVYREITSGTGPVLFWVEDDGEAVGFTVANRFVEPYSRKTLLVLEMTYLEPLSNVLVPLRDAVDELAEEMGCDRVEWYSPRVGWQRVMNTIDYQAGCHVYYREVKHG